MGLPALSLDRHIEITEGVRGGKPCLSGRRIAVDDIAILHLHTGKSLEEIAADYDLSLPAVHAAMAYYHEHRDEIDARMEADQAFADAMRAQQTFSPLQKKLAKLGID